MKRVLLEPGRPMPPLFAVCFATPFLVTGLLTIAIGLGWIGVDPAKATAPGWAIAVAGVVFLCGGLAVLASAFGDPARAGRPFALVIVAGIWLLFHWVAFGEGERQFTSSTRVVGFMAESGPATEGSGRFAFGAFALLLDVWIVASLVRWWRGRETSRDPGRPPTSATG